MGKDTARIKLVVGAGGEVSAKVELGLLFPVFDENHVAPSDPKEQVAEALEYALDAMVRERPEDALEFCSQKLREFDKKYVR